jgi:catechol 2,3-dioxygenase-like lactoylglutathione lyase family enzyme
MPVTDQERALRFYADELGLETRLDLTAGPTGRWIEVAPADSDVTLALIPATSAAPSGVETGLRLITLDADSEHARLHSHGVEVGEVLRWPGVPPMFMLHDPDGNSLEIIERQ